MFKLFIVTECKWEIASCAFKKIASNVGGCGETTDVMLKKLELSKEFFSSSRRSEKLLIKMEFEVKSSEFQLTRVLFGTSSDEHEIIALINFTCAE